MTRSGLTLVELIVAVAVMSIVVIMGFQFFNFNVGLFFRSDNQYELQSEIRIASDELIRKVRNVSEISVHEAAEIDQITFRPEYEYILINAEDLTYKKPGSNLEKKMINGSLNAANSYFVLKQVSNKWFLEYKLSASLSDQSFSVSSEVLLNNITLASSFNPISPRKIIYIQYKP